MMMAQVTGLQAGEFVHTLAMRTLFSITFEQARLQLSRAPRALPVLRLIRP